MRKLEYCSLSQCSGATLVHGVLWIQKIVEPCTIGADWVVD